MGDELISKQQVCDVLARFAPENYTQLVEMLVVKLPAVDAVPVVRCKHCKHGVWDADEELWKCVISADWIEEVGDYIGFFEYHEADDFCSYGERRKENAAD